MKINLKPNPITKFFSRYIVVIVTTVIFLTLATGIYFYYQLFIQSDKIDQSKINQNQVIFSKKAINNIRELQARKPVSRIKKGQRTNPFN